MSRFDDDPWMQPTATRDAEPDILDPQPAAQPIVLASSGADVYAPLMQALPDGDRDRDAMIKAARWVGSRLGKAAIYSWETKGKRGASLVEGPTIKLAQALAGEWGGCVFAATILERTPVKATFRGIFGDARRKTLVIRDYQFALSPPPAGFSRDPANAQRWATMQEQSAASKAVRGVILSGLPEWFVGAAVEASREAAAAEALTDRDGNRITVDQAAGTGVDALGRLGLTEADLVAYIGQPRALWTVAEIHRLRELYAALRSGATTAARVKADLAGEQAPPPTPAAERAGFRPAPTSTPTSTVAETVQADPEIEAARERLLAKATALCQPDALATFTARINGAARAGDRAALDLVARDLAELE